MHQTATRNDVHWKYMRSKYSTRSWFTICRLWLHQSEEKPFGIGWDGIISSNGEGEGEGKDGKQQRKIDRAHVSKSVDMCYRCPLWYHDICLHYLRILVFNFHKIGNLAAAPVLYVSIYLMCKLLTRKYINNLLKLSHEKLKFGIIPIFHRSMSEDRIYLETGIMLIRKIDFLRRMMVQARFGSFCFRAWNTSNQWSDSHKSIQRPSGVITHCKEHFQQQIKFEEQNALDVISIIAHNHIECVRCVRMKLDGYQKKTRMSCYRILYTKTVWYVGAALLRRLPRICEKTIKSIFLFSNIVRLEMTLWPNGTIIFRSKMSKSSI